MKTVKTSSGLRWIEDSDDKLISLQLREVLQEQRKSLIARLLNDNGVVVYVQHKRGLKLNFSQLAKIKEALVRLMNSGIDYYYYQPILNAVTDRDHTSLDTSFFYREIDNCIQDCLQDSQLTLPNMDGPMFGVAGFLDDMPAPSQN